VSSARLRAIERATSSTRWNRTSRPSRCGTEFSGGLPSTVLAWMLLARRREIPAQPSTRRRGVADD
jgi:hypothetical protein